MGRWAQAQRRGSVKPGETVTPPQEDPPDPLDWDVTDAGFDTFIAECDTGVGPKAQARCKDLLTGTYAMSSAVALGDPAFIGVVIGAAPGRTYSASMRFCNSSGNPISDWSSNKIAAFT